MQCDREQENVEHRTQERSHNQSLRKTCVLESIGADCLRCLANVDRGWRSSPGRHLKSGKSHWCCGCQGSFRFGRRCYIILLMRLVTITEGKLKGMSICRKLTSGSPGLIPY